jgi:hypothetical protein
LIKYGSQKAAVAVCRPGPGRLEAHEGAFFPILVLREPPKAKVLAWKPGSSLRREAFAVVMDRPASRTYEAVVDLASHGPVLDARPRRPARCDRGRIRFRAADRDEGPAMAGGDEEARGANYGGSSEGSLVEAPYI